MIYLPTFVSGRVYISPHSAAEAMERLRGVRSSSLRCLAERVSTSITLCIWVASFSSKSVQHSIYISICTMSLVSLYLSSAVLSFMVVIALLFRKTFLQFIYIGIHFFYLTDYGNGFGFGELPCTMYDDDHFLEGL